MFTKAVGQPDLQPALPELPQTAITKDGQIVDLTAAVWVIRAASDGGRLILLNWSNFPEAAKPLDISRRACHIAKMYIAWRLAFCKGHTIQNDFSMLRRLLRWYALYACTNGLEMSRFDWNLLDEGAFRAFLAHGLARPDRGNDFARLRKMYKWGAFGAELAEFDRGLAIALAAIKAPGNIKGAAVRFHDSHHGPLSLKSGI